MFLSLEVNAGLIFSYMRQLTLLILIRLPGKGALTLRFLILYLWDCYVCFPHSFRHLLDKSIWDFIFKSLHLIVGIFIQYCKLVDQYLSTRFMIYWTQSRKVIVQRTYPFNNSNG